MKSPSDLFQQTAPRSPPFLGLVSAASSAFVVLLILFPRFVTVLSLAAVTAVLLALFANERIFKRPPTLRWIERTPLTIGFAALIAVMFAACTWAYDPLDSVLKVLFLAAIGASYFALSAQSIDWNPDVRGALLVGLLTGMAIGAAYIAIEIYSDREIQRQIHNFIPQLRSGFEKHLRLDKSGDVLRISDATINRSTFAFSCLVWPAFLVLKSGYLKRWRLPLGIVLMAGIVSIVLYSTHQSSQLAIAVSAVAFGIALLSRRIARAIVTAGVITLFVLMIPFSHYATEYGFHTNESVPTTMRARLIYWNYTADRILERPWFGVGVNSTEPLHMARNTSQLPRPPGYLKVPGTGVHPHNIYLQLWYEVGVFGVIAALVTLLVVIVRTARLPPETQAFALAHITLISLLTMASYSLWQTWFQCMVAFSAVAFVLASNRTEGTDRTVDGS